METNVLTNNRRIRGATVKICKDEYGGSLAEFALIGPLLFVILFGIIEFGILLYDKAMLTNASREGARAGIVYDFDADGPSNDGTPTYWPTDSVVKKRVRDYCETYLISFDSEDTFSDTNIDVEITDSSGTVLTNATASSGDNLTVTVNYDFSFLVISNIIGAFFGDTFGDIELEAVTTMRLE
jgi:Flp pilus assembly protein TadG